MGSIPRMPQGPGYRGKVYPATPRRELITEWWEVRPPATEESAQDIVDAYAERRATKADAARTRGDHKYLRLIHVRRYKVVR